MTKSFISCAWCSIFWNSTDPLYQEYLNTLRYFKPSAMLLRELQPNRVLCSADPPSDSHISDVLKSHSDAVVLTISIKQSQTPAEGNTKTLQHTFVMAKLQFFACPGSCTYYF